MCANWVQLTQSDNNNDSLGANKISKAFYYSTPSLTDSITILP